MSQEAVFSKAEAGKRNTLKVYVPSWVVVRWRFIVVLREAIKIACICWRCNLPDGEKNRLLMGGAAPESRQSCCVGELWAIPWFLSHVLLMPPITHPVSSCLPGRMTNHTEKFRKGQEFCQAQWLQFQFTVPLGIGLFLISVNAFSPSDISQTIGMFFNGYRGL